jgi:hypothetical protein
MDCFVAKPPRNRYRRKSGQAFVIAKAGIVGLGVTYTPTADVPLGQSGEFPGSCASCSVNRVYWETTKGDLGAVIGPINLSLISKQGDMLVNEYGKSGLISSSVIPGGPPTFDPSVSLGADRKIGVKLDASYYGEVGCSVPWQDIKTFFGASSGTSTPASGAPK